MSLLGLPDGSGLRQVQNCHPLDHSRYNRKVVEQAASTGALSNAIYGDPEKAAAAEYIATHSLLSPDSAASSE